MSVSLPHIKAVESVLLSLPSDMPVVRAMVVCEDAMAALSTALYCGLSLEQARQQMSLLVQELTEANP